MAIEPWIDITGSLLPHKEALSFTRDTTLTPHQSRILGFCSDWINGRQTFEITTSGSTGTPKKIVLRREQMVASASRTARALDLRRGMTSLVCIDTNYIGGMMMLVRALEIGMNIVVEEPSATPLKNGRHTIDFAAMVPYQVLNSGDTDFNGKIIIGGAPATPELIEKVKRIGHATFYATFGMTETLSHIALQRLNGPEPQDHFYTLDGVEVSSDDRECLVIKADYLSDAIVTNDVVQIVTPHEFKWLGRFDNVINSGGVKLIPEKIEQAVGTWLTSNGFDNRFFVTGMDHHRLGSQVVLVVEGWMFEGAERKLIEALRSMLGKYEVPKVVMYSKIFTYTPTGKINRKQSLENALPRPSGR